MINFLCQLQAKLPNTSMLASAHDLLVSCANTNLYAHDLRVSCADINLYAHILAISCANAFPLNIEFS